MPRGNLFDEARVRGLPDGGELVLGKDDLATPAALDVAFAKGIRVRWAADGARGAGPTGAATPAPHGSVWQKMLSADATYVVEVRGGRAVVHKLTSSGPVPLGEGH